ncbi:Wzz/FepE/Etk N-terminal domain-containing protein [Ideonella sp.]|uniref:Wzz/FepE/Etk N-terminal domain-containing protein n=1 Tax=Ideonella sp. TaxID=1929293 RepID=UPI003BB7AF90
MSLSPMPTQASPVDRALTNAVPVEIDLNQAVRTLSAHARLLVLLPLLVGALAVAATFLVKPKFQSTVRMLPPQQAQSTASALVGSLGGLAGLAGGAGAVGALAGLKNPSDQWIGILGSRTISDALIKQYKLQDRYALEFLYETRDELKDRSSIQVGKDGLISIDVLDEDPAFAAQLANAYVEQLRTMTKDLAVSEAAQRRVFFEQQLKLARNGLVKADGDLQSAGVNEGVIKSVPEATVGALAELRARAAASEIRISVLRGSLTDESAEMRAALREQSELSAQVARLEKSGPSGLTGKAEQYINSVRNVKYYETLFEIMARQYELARADEARDGALIQVIDEAVPAERKATPKRGLIGAVAAALAFVLTVFGVLLSHARSVRIVS